MSMIFGFAGGYFLGRAANTGKNSDALIGTVSLIIAFALIFV